jgi:cytochrome c556
MSNIRARFHFRNRAVTAAGALVLLVNGWAMAQGAPRAEALIKWRQSAYQVLAWNSGRIKAALAGPYDAREVQSAANALAAVANSGLAGLFSAGTAEGKGWRATTASAAVFGDAAKFRALNAEFARDASELARLAGGVDRQALNDQFLKVAKDCKSCHEQFREID